MRTRGVRDSLCKEPMEFLAQGSWLLNKALQGCQKRLTTYNRVQNPQCRNFTFHLQEESKVRGNTGSSDLEVMEVLEFIKHQIGLN